MSLAKLPVLLPTVLCWTLASCDNPNHPPAEKSSQQVTAKPCDDFTVREETENELATLRALEHEMIVDLETKRAHADALMRAGQDEKGIKAAVDDLHDSQEQLLKIKKRILDSERKIAELNDPQRKTRSEREKKEEEVATLQALATELNLDLDGKKAHCTAR
jgi:chromosome segregation ATPase